MLLIRILGLGQPRRPDVTQEVGEGRHSLGARERKETRGPAERECPRTEGVVGIRQR